MKNVWLFVLMIVFPLQAALAAVGAYHSHEPEAAIESVLHTHSDHDHAQGEGHDAGSQSSSKSSSKSVCEGDHHHCHGHGVTVLPSVVHFEFPPKSLAKAFEPRKAYLSHLSNRIERPKWV